MQEQKPTIKLIAVDIDGTLLNNKLELSERNERALRAALEAGIHVVLATGKTRNAGVKMIEKLGIKSPGIYSQGLMTYAPDGKVLHQQTLSPAVARQVITFAEDRGFKLFAYSGTRILIRNRDAQMIEEIMRYHEPAPEVVGPLQNLVSDVPLNKIMAVGEPRAIKALRWQLNAQLNGSCRLVQAGLSNMLEILPPGGSKGTALRQVLKDLKISPEHVLAMGDGENDIEMLELVGLPVAVGNANPMLKAVAKHVVGTNDEDGVAEAIERFVIHRTLDVPKTAEAEKVIDVPTTPAEIKAEAAERAATAPEIKPETPATEAAPKAETKADDAAKTPAESPSATANAPSPALAPEQITPVNTDTPSPAPTEPTPAADAPKAETKNDVSAAPAQANAPSPALAPEQVPAEAAPAAPEAKPEATPSPSDTSVAKTNESPAAETGSPVVTETDKQEVKQ